MAAWAMIAPIFPDAAEKPLFANVSRFLRQPGVKKAHLHKSLSKVTGATARERYFQSPSTRHIMKSGREGNVLRGRTIAGGEALSRDNECGGVGTEVEKELGQNIKSEEGVA